MTPSQRPPDAAHPSPDDANPSEPQRRDKLERQLDDALAATFPASDPVSIMPYPERLRPGTD